MENNSDEVHDYDYLLVVDFEAQCSKTEELEFQEIVEFPVFVVDVKEKKFLDNYFHYYIKPTKYPILFDFCKELTGITQEQVDNGISIDTALEKFHLFLEENSVLDKKFCFVTDGNCDIKNFLNDELDHNNNIIDREYYHYWMNLKDIYSKFTEDRKNGIGRMLNHFGLELEGKKHSGKDDTKNITRIVIELLKKGCKFNKDWVRTTIKKEIKGKKKEKIV